MTDTTHTPGPWEVTVDGWGGGELHLSVFIPDKTQDLEEAFQAAEANARLIAAAQDLLASLQTLLASDLVAWFPQWSPEGNREAGAPPWSEELKQRAAPILAARAAIAKAIG